MDTSIGTTSKKVAEELMMVATLNTQGLKILEPSAGRGYLAEYIEQFSDDHNLNVQLDCVELNEERYNILVEKGFNVVGRDIMNYNPKYKYDRVIACPSFLGGKGILQIQKMHELCKSSGHVITLTTPWWMSSMLEHAKNFRKWLQKRDYFMYLLPDNSYKANGESIPSIVMVISGR